MAIRLVQRRFWKALSEPRPSGSCEKIGRIAGLTDESACPTLLLKDSRARGAGAFACQPIFSQLLRERWGSLYRNWLLVAARWNATILHAFTGIGI